MPFSPVSGVGAAVKVGATSYAFAKWSVNFKANLPKVNNFLSAYQQLVEGIKSATVTVEGPYDEGNDAWSVGSSYTIVLSWDGAVSLTVTGLLESIEGSQDIEDAGRLKLVFQSSGSFVGSVV